MNYPRTYGSPPFTVAVIHGGPGAAGEMAPVARELASGWGVLEPLQTAASLEGQVEELKTFLSEQGDLPVTLTAFPGVPGSALSLRVAILPWSRNCSWLEAVVSKNNMPRTSGRPG